MSFHKMAMLRQASLTRKAVEQQTTLMFSAANQAQNAALNEAWHAGHRQGWADAMAAMQAKNAHTTQGGDPHHAEA